MMKRFNNLSGKKFNRWTVLFFVGKRKLGDRFRPVWRCQCDCGTEKNVPAIYLMSETSRSCGCLNRESVVTHGMTNSPEYNSWKSMMGRCYNKNNPEYRNYGERGILVVQRWHAFKNFFADMGLRPVGVDGKRFTIERINNNSNYSPVNCKWATDFDQAKNRRVNRRIVYRGKSKIISDWAREVGISKTVIRQRLNRGWSVKKVLEEPVRKVG